MWAALAVIRSLQRGILKVHADFCTISAEMNSAAERVLPFLVLVPSPRKALPLVLLPLVEMLSAVHGYQRCARGLGFPAEIPTRGISHTSLVLLPSRVLAISANNLKTLSVIKKKKEQEHCV